ncbi:MULTISPECIES: hypothetical protein [unclassified Bradyrhizobium]|uniref:hypothetical protein n=1 Tax=unclassified Bradyrhizobium TaxID=2631580 RepID=UPI001FFA3EEE|nr:MULTISPECIES: hypothetical protein [unclassified Bradyrhizobium]
MADPAEQPVDQAAELEAAVAQEIEACGGDPVGAVRADCREQHARAGVVRCLRQGVAWFPTRPARAEAQGSMTAEKGEPAQKKPNPA